MIDEEFNKQVHLSAVKFRLQKINEFLVTPEDQRKEMDESIIKTWIKEYGNSCY